MTDQQAKALTLPILARIAEQDKLDAFMRAMALPFAAAAQALGNGRTLMEELMSVQPMMLPTAEVFYMDFIYGESKWKTMLRHWRYYLCHPVILCQELVRTFQDLLPW